MTPAPGPRDRPAPPQSVSEEAQRLLAANWREPTPQPALDDTDGWLKLAEERDRELAEMVAPRLAGVVADVEERAVGGVPTYVIRPEGAPDAPDAPVYLDVHGGALVFGAGEACRAMATASALGTGLVHWAVDYRMPPLHPYPASLDDCMTVYRHLIAERDPRRVVVGGASAGGNLAAALAVRARDEGLPPPAGLVLLTPEVDLTESGDTFRTNLGIDNVLTSSLMQANLLYAGGTDLRHPYVSPLFAELGGLPPTFVQAGTRDLFLSNAVRMHRALRDAGVEAELHVFEAMPHGGFGGAPEDLAVRVELRRFLERVLGR